jgi:peptidoglycan pentaglycine glycine transferase (the first glycine)
MPEVSAAEWGQWLVQFPDVHILQTANWGALKESFGWDPVRVIAESPGATPIGAQILFRKLPFGLQMAYIAKGPVGAPGELPPHSPAWKDLWQEVDAICRKRRAVFLKVEPDLWQVESAEQSPSPQGFKLARHSIQPLRTILVDLTASEDQQLARMKQKTRYNIRLAQKRGVLVYPSSDLDTFYRLLTTTGDRDAFGVHSQDYYNRAYELFHPRSQCELLMAVYEEKPLAGMLVFNNGKRAWYFYGASGDAHRELMPTYLLQWEAMRWARSQGCCQYDLWGVPDADEDILEANFTERSDNLWGVYRFKRGFGGQLQRAAGPWDRVYRPFWYRLYRTTIQFRGGGKA